MKAWLAILFTIGLLAACYIVSAAIYFDLTWILIWITSFWAGIDSSKIELKRYKLGIACGPAALFCMCALLWIFIFPWYLWARYKIKSGTALLKDETLGNIGPVRRFFRRFSRITERVAESCLIGLVGLKIVLLLFCLEEYWRGEKAWETCKRELEARGETLDWNAPIPPPVPDSQNFFSAPKMSQWFIKPSGKTVFADDLTNRLHYTNVTAAVVLMDLTVVARDAHPGAGTTNTLLKFDEPASRQRAKELIPVLVGSSAFGAQGSEMFVAKPLNTNQFKPLQVSLEADKTPTPRDIVEFFNKNSSGSGSLGIKPTGSNSFRILTPMCAASDYLAWSDRFQSDFKLIREALKRPYARMNGDYHYPPTIPIPNFVAVRAVAQTLAQRAQCYLVLGQPEKALQELTQLRDLCRLLEGAPTGKPMSLVAAMINVAVTGLYTDVIADGFRLHAWQEPQLVTLQKQLGQINLAPFVIESFRAERVSAWRIMQTDVLAKFVTPRIPNATLWQKIRNLRPPNILKGFFLLNMVTIVELDQKAIESVNPVQRIVLPEKMADFQREEDKIGGHFSPYTFFAAIVVPNYTKAVQTFAYNQTKVDEAQIACVLERYRFAHDKYPETLDELVPQFIKKLPHDIIGGQPLKYRRTADGRFVLYSVGWNGTDDGGQMCSFPYDKGDWGWQ